MKKSFIFASFVAMVAMLASCSKELPTPRFDYEAEGLVVTFINQSKNADTFAWDFGDGSAISKEQAPVHEYAEAGTYSVKLTASNKDGEKTLTQEIVLTALSVNITIDGDFSDWAEVPASLLAEAKVDEIAVYDELYDIKFCTDADYIYFYMEYNGQEFEIDEEGTKTTIGVLDIFFNTDGKAETGFACWLWQDAGADILIEGGTDFDGDKEYWYPEGFKSLEFGTADWQWDGLDLGDGIKVSEIKSFNGHKALEGSIMRASLNNPTSLKVGVLTQGAGWSGEYGSLPEMYIDPEGASVAQELMEVKLN